MRKTITLKTTWVKLVEVYRINTGTGTKVNKSASGIKKYLSRNYLNILFVTLNKISLFTFKRYLKEYQAIFVSLKLELCSKLQVWEDL